MTSAHTARERDINAPQRRGLLGTAPTPLACGGFVRRNSVTQASQSAAAHLKCRPAIAFVEYVLFCELRRTTAPREISNHMTDRASVSYLARPDDPTSPRDCILPQLRFAFFRVHRHRLVRAAGAAVVIARLGYSVRWWVR